MHDFRDRRDHAKSDCTDKQSRLRLTRVTPVKLLSHRDELETELQNCPLIIVMTGQKWCFVVIESLTFVVEVRMDVKELSNVLTHTYDKMKCAKSQCDVGCVSIVLCVVL